MPPRDYPSVSVHMVLDDRSMKSSANAMPSPANSLDSCRQGRRKRVNFESVSTSATVSRKRIGLMRRGGVLFFAFLLTVLPELRAEKIDNRNFAFDTYYPTP